MFQLVVHEFLQEIVYVKQSLHLQCGGKESSTRLYYHRKHPNDLQSGTKRGTHFHVWNKSLLDLVAVVRDWLDVGALFTERASHRSPCCVATGRCATLRQLGSITFWFRSVPNGHVNLFPIDIASGRPPARAPCAVYQKIFGRDQVEGV